MKKKKIVGIILLLAIWVLPSRAQVGEQRHNLAIGFNGGINLNSINFSPTIQQKNLMGINGGVTLRYISEKYFRMICGAQVELNFSQHGWDEYYEDYPDLQYTRKMNYIEIPLLAHIALGKEQGMQIFIHAGPQVGFFINDTQTINDAWNTTSTNYLTIEQHDKKIENKFDYGITGGAGLELRTNIGNFLVEGRYYYALSDFYKNTKKDYFARSAHSTIVVKMTYLFDLKN